MFRIISQTCIAIVLILISCKGSSIKAIQRNGISAELFRYQAAHGSGSGWVVRIKLPDGWENRYTFDSIYVKGIPLPCHLTDMGRTLEANYFFSSSREAVFPEDTISEKTDSLAGIFETNFKPSFIIAQRGGKKFRISISSFTAMED